ncbi:Epsin-3, clathrin recruitment and traffic between the Golgi and endosome [Serendipita sp. 399]|nr:Epsin-3, clathrin recruitment and traffic between the Golgi and endosome [Serendipita sp. 399]
MVLNVSEMEAKVQEATNDDPWGASSTLMGEIAQGFVLLKSLKSCLASRSDANVSHSQHFNEIMPAIYSRFMDKEAREWRQIYKALQLLEYMIKHGSERVVDDARSHLSTLKMLRNFHYIDEKGKDQGINVRNRAKEIAELLSDLDKVRQERRKAKLNKSKYTGVGNDGLSFGSGGRYGGFSSDDYYGSGGGSSYSGGGGSSYSGGGSSSYAGDYGSNRKQFEEYDAGDDEDRPTRTSTSTSTSHQRQSSVPKSATAPSQASPAKPAVPAKDKAKAVDLLGFDDDTSEPQPSAPAPTITATKAPSVAPSSNDFDDFDDFQSAPSVAPSVAAPVHPAPLGKPAPPPAYGANVFDLLNATAPASAGVTAPPMVRPNQTSSSLGSGSGSGMGMNAPLMPTNPMMPSMAYKSAAPSAFGGQATPTQGGRSTPTPANQSKSAASFDDLWSSSLSGAGRTAAPVTGGTSGKTIMDLQKEKAQAAFWGPGQGQQQQPKAAGMGSGLGGATTSTNANNGLDDLLF